MTAMQALHLPWCPYIHGADDRPRTERWTMPSRRLAHWLLVTSLDGPEEIAVDGRAWSIPRDGTYCIQPGRLHDLSGHGNRPAWVHFDLVFDPRRAKHPYAGPYQSDLGPRRSLLQPDAMALFGVDLPVLATGRMARVLSNAVPRIVALHKRGEAIAVLEARQRLGELFIAWVGDLGGGGALSASDRLGRVEAAVMAHLDLPWPVDEMAAVAGLGRSAFCDCWRSARRESPAVWLRRMRMERAAELLAHRGIDAATAGRLVGYADASVFGRAFRAVHGCTPGAWRGRQSG
jgi:AraC-like DNA-binding protein